ncbi:MAG: hypothetical protein ACI4ML_10145 [Aristaeellaceae bacterium]
MSKKSGLARMDKVSLLELLSQLTEENETLKRRVRELEEANAELALRDHELTAKADQAERVAEECRRYVEQMEEEKRKADRARDDLPVGSFAQAMIAAQEVVQRTQQAADDYLAACQRRASEAETEAEAIVAAARGEAEERLWAAGAQAEEIVRQAEERKRALEAREAEIRQRLRSEIAGLNRMVERLEQEEA